MEGKTALILGLGLSGKSVATYLLNRKVNLIGVDKKALDLKMDFPVFQENEITTLSGIDFIVKSPGVPNEHPLLVLAQKEKVPVTSEIELGLKHLQNKPDKRLFAITGSNGKTTTTLLVEHLLNSSGKKALACGNVGVSLLSQVENEAEFFIVELSSYQLETLDIPLFEMGIILNITPNHLDRYPSMEAYAKSKLNLQRCLKKQGELLIGKEAFEEWQPFILAAKPLLLQNIAEKIERIFPSQYRDGRFCWIRSHDIQNLSAAFAICQKAGLTEDEFWQGVLSFKKPPHRLEFVREWKGVLYVNDSKATSIDAVLKAVESIETEMILIAGGLDKGGGYASWIPLFKNKVKKVLLIGQAAEKIQKELEPHVRVEKVENLNNAVRAASLLAKAGECVLFSPGCASFDQFSDYQKRGEAFKQLIMELSL